MTVRQCSPFKASKETSMRATAPIISMVLYFYNIFINEMTFGSKQLKLLLNVFFSIKINVIHIEVAIIPCLHLWPTLGSTSSVRLAVLEGLARPTPPRSGIIDIAVVALSLLFSVLSARLSANAVGMMFTVVVVVSVRVNRRSAPTPAECDSLVLVMAIMAAVLIGRLRA